MSTPARADRDAQLRSVIRSSFIGTTIEWYDFYTYATMASLVIGKLFFPVMSDGAGTLAALSTFAAGFVSRPLGGLIFGHFGDRVGRKRMLVLSLVLMGGSSFLMGALPTYASIGMAAPAILVVLRLVQGLALGGEWGGASTMVIEHSPHGRRGRNGALVQVGAVFGGVISYAVILCLDLLMPEGAFLAWGWRIPFLLSAILVISGIVIRLRIQESPVFRELRERRQVARLPVLDALRSQPKQVVLVFFMYLADTVIAYINATFVVAHATDSLGVDQNTILATLMAIFFIAVLFAPRLGTLADRIGRRPVFLAGTIGMIVIAFPYLLLVDTGNIWLIAVALALGQIVNMLMYMPLAAFFMELFTPRVRYSGASLGVQLSTVAGGGTAPIIATALVAWAGGRIWAVGLYLVVIGLLASVAKFFACETKDLPAGDEPAGAEPQEQPA